MILNVSKEFLNEILKAHKYELLGKLMKRYEVIYSQDKISLDQRKNLLRELIKEEIHESFRDLETKLLCHSKGVQLFQVETIRPSSK
jgi:hypothetical protein